MTTLNYLNLYNGSTLYLYLIIHLTSLKAGLICLLTGVIDTVVGRSIIPVLCGVDSLPQVGGITSALALIFLAGGNFRSIIQPFTKFI
ncbi:MAG: hypothetical protein ACFFAE_21755 [Candidatus Hodarchaeota archaeon]